MDSLAALAARPSLRIDETGGTAEIQYLNFNSDRDPLLADPRVRQAISCAIDRNLIIGTLLGNHAQPAESLLPPTHWAYNADGPRFGYDPARANLLLDQAGHPRAANGTRFQLAMKTSTDQ